MHSGSRAVHMFEAGGDARQFLDSCGLEGLDKVAFAHGKWLRLNGQLTT